MIYISAYMIGLGTSLRQLVDALDGSVDEMYRRRGLAFRARFFPYFRLLETHDRLAVGEFAAMLGCTQPAVTQTLALMRGEGLVELVPSDDRRERRYRLTGQARDMLADLRRVWAAAERAAARLDATLPAPLAATVTGALQQLSLTPFQQMIEEELHRASSDDRADPVVLAHRRSGAAAGADRPR